MGASRGAMNSLLYVAMLALLTLGSCTPSLSVVDRARAHASKPRSTLTGPDFSSMTASLNQQIQSLGASTRDCSSFTIPELHQLIKVLMASKHDGLQIIYQASLDQRGLLHSTIPSLELHWLQEAAILAAHPDLATISRDGKCHLAVLLFAHHLSQPAREQVRSLSTLPLLPKQHHDQNKFLTSAPPLRGEVSHRVAAVEAVHRDYARASSCADGHIIGTGQSSWVKGCLGSEECPVWPAEFSAPFGMYSTLPPIKNASSTFYYKVHEDGTKAAGGLQHVLLPICKSAALPPAVQTLFPARGNLPLPTWPRRLLPVQCCQCERGASSVPTCIYFERHKCDID